MAQTAGHRRRCWRDAEALPRCVAEIVIALPPGVRAHLAYGLTDMRRGFDCLAAQLQMALKRDPHDGALFVFRGTRGDLGKTLQYAPCL